jgi:uncharacterized protein
MSLAAPGRAEIPVDDPDRAAGFYRDGAGLGDLPFRRRAVLASARGPGEEPGANGALVGCGDLHRSPVLTVGVDDIDDALRRVQRYGGTVAQPKLPVPGVGWSAYVLDSEGNTIGLFQPDTSATAGW